MKRFRLLQLFAVFLAAHIACSWVIRSVSDLATAGTVTLSKTWSNGETLTHTDLNSNFNVLATEINGNLNALNLASTLTFSDGDLIDLSSINMSSSSEGLKLGQATSCASATAEGQTCWDSDDNALYVGTGSAATLVGPVGGSAGIMMPSGAVFFMITGSCPTGSTDVSATYTDKFLMVNATAGSTGGSATHSHDVPYDSWATGGSYSGNGYVVVGGASTNNSANADEATDSASSLPPYITAKLCKVS